MRASAEATRAEGGPRLRRRRAAVAAGALALFALVVVKNAWLGDDAYVSFRCAWNLVHGHGLRWNVAERVQAFTNPLWTLLFAGAYAVTREVYLTAVALSLALSLAAAALLAARARTAGLAALALLGLAASRAYTDFSTGGLENPLLHLLLVGLVLAAPAARDAAPAPRRVLALALLVGLAACARLDAVLLLAPPLLAVAAHARPRGRALGALVLGFAPLAAWEAFAVVYYGFPFPNTAYAKLGVGVPLATTLAQGLRYLAHSAWNDPATALALAAGLALAARDPRPLARGVGAGVVLHLAYVVWIGGDFMSGRFLALPLAGLAALAATTPLALRRAAPAAAAALVALALVAPRSHLLSGPAFGTDPEDVARVGLVGDERAFYFPSTGLVHWRPGGGFPRHPWIGAGRRIRRRAEAAPPGETVVELVGALGFVGFHAGPRAHVVDVFALADPLLARLPARQPVVGGVVTVGHFARLVPLGFVEARAGTGALVDPALAALDAELARITRGPLWTRARWRAVLRAATGGLAPLVEAYVGRPPARTTPAELAAAPDGLAIPRNGVVVELPAAARAAALELDLDPLTIYRVSFLRAGAVVAETRLELQGGDTRALAVPPEAAAGFDALRLEPLFGYGDYRLRALRL